MADALAETIGSWGFLIVQSLVVCGWMVVNLAAILRQWDPYPFVLLNLLFSIQATYTGPIILLSANRAAERDRIMAENDYVTNEKGEQLIEAVMSELLRNSRATLAIAKHLEIPLDELVDHDEMLKDKFERVQDRLKEVEEVVGEEDRDPPKPGDDGR